MPGPSASDGSDRVHAARLAREAALATPGVIDLDSGTSGLFQTAGGGTRVRGVTAAVAPEGGYDVALRLVCALVTLPPLADRVRSAIETAARGAGIALASVTLDIVDVVETGAEAV